MVLLRWPRYKIKKHSNTDSKTPGKKDNQTQIDQSRKNLGTRSRPTGEGDKRQETERQKDKKRYLYSSQVGKEEKKKKQQGKKRQIRERKKKKEKKKNGAVNGIP